jgi:hypothetical protein
MQLCAKVGGEPWAIAELPYCSRLTTTIGIHVTEESVSVVSSMNQSCTRYWSKNTKILNPDLIEALIDNLVAEGLLAFKMRVAAFPKYVFVYTTYEEVSDLSKVFGPF